jgi:hypothetical protein
MSMQIPPQSAAALVTEPPQASTAAAAPKSAVEQAVDRFFDDHPALGTVLAKVAIATTVATTCAAWTAAQAVAGIFNVSRNAVEASADTAVGLWHLFDDGHRPSSAPRAPSSSE